MRLSIEERWHPKLHRNSTIGVSACNPCRLNSPIIYTSMPDMCRRSCHLLKYTMKDICIIQDYSTGIVQLQKLFRLVGYITKVSSTINSLLGIKRTGRSGQQTDDGYCFLFLLQIMIFWLWRRKEKMYIISLLNGCSCPLKRIAMELVLWALRQSFWDGSRERTINEAFTIL